MGASPEQPNYRIAVVVSFEQLPLKLLSAYGSELGQTPNFDRMAAHGVLFDQHFADDLGASRTRHAWWDGMTAVRAEVASTDQTLATICSAAGIACHLISDSPPSEWDVAPQGWETHYRDTQSESASEGMGELFATALTTIDQLRQNHQSAIVWIHSREMPSLPIPGMEFLELYLNELPQLAEVEEEMEVMPSEEGEDGDLDGEDEELGADESALAFGLIEETLSILSEEEGELDAIHIKTLNVLAAARLSEWDHALGQFCDRLSDDLESGNTIFLLTSDKGLPLWESHVTQQLERDQLLGPLQEETMHLPLLLLRERQPLGERVGAFTQPADLPATILDWLQVEYEFPDGRSLLSLVNGSEQELHQVLVCRAGDWESVRERKWLLIRNRHEGIEKLYIKPEDRWQVLDVSSQYIDEVDRLLALFSEREQV